MLKLAGITQMRELVGNDLGVSAWYEITQARIDAFAAATDDFEAIHVDPERGKQTPFGRTIAHGLYTLSLGPKFLYELYSMSGHSLALNYGFERVRFIAPVPTGSRVRMAATVVGADEVTGGARFTIRQTFEIEGADKPACVADAVVAYFD